MNGRIANISTAQRAEPDARRSCGRPLRVSVVIPAYNAARTIARPIASLLAQSIPPDEIIVVDDGSLDDVGSALKGFGTRVTLYRKPNGGAASARNFGIDRATGDLIAFLDADDEWEAHKLELQLAVFDAFPDVGVVGSLWYDEDPNGQRAVAPVTDPTLFGRPLGNAGRAPFDVAMCMWTSTLVIRRELLRRRRFESGLEPAEDRDLWVRLASAASVYLVDEPLATYVQVPGSLSRSNVDRDCGNMLRVVRRNAGLIGPKNVKVREAEVFRRWAGGHLKNGRPSEAIKPAGHRLARDPASPEAWWVLAKCLVSAAVGRITRGAANSCGLA